MTRSSPGSREAAHEGWEPATLDLEQALLRLDLEELLPEPFDALATPAGRQAAAWITGAGPDVPTVRAVRTLRGTTREYFSWDHRPASPPHLWVAEVVPRDGPEPKPAGALWTLLHSWSPHPRGVAVTPGWESTFSLWAWAAPHHRNVVAAHLLRTLGRALTDPSRAGDALVPLACAEGPVGDAMLLAHRVRDGREAAGDPVRGRRRPAGPGRPRPARRCAARTAAGSHGDRRRPGHRSARRPAQPRLPPRAPPPRCGLRSPGCWRRPSPRTGRSRDSPLLSAAVDIAEDHRSRGTVAGPRRHGGPQGPQPASRRGRPPPRRPGPQRDLSAASSL